ncbi:MAG: alpha/beta hydrolase [Chloroflexi bacterium]|nr:alpha/beta hydrolase [Chloroflexota bacterium]
MPLSSGMYYACSHSGPSGLPPLILIHGAGSDHLCWPAPLRRLCGWTVLAVDLPGHGRSDGAAVQSIEGYAASLLEFLDGLQLYQVVLVGHSMGGAVAQHLACCCPERVAGLALLSCGSNLKGADDLAELLCNPVTRAGGLHKLEDMLFARGAEAALVNRTMQSLRAARPGVIFADWLACAHFESSDWLGQISAPTWVAVGAQDRLTPPGASIYLAGQIPRAQMRVVEHAGHMLMLEQPQKTAEGLSAWLEGLNLGLAQT